MIIPNTSPTQNLSLLYLLQQRERKNNKLNTDNPNKHQTNRNIIHWFVSKVSDWIFQVWHKCVFITFHHQKTFNKCELIDTPLNSSTKFFSFSPYAFYRKQLITFRWKPKSFKVSSLSDKLIGQWLILDRISIIKIYSQNDTSFKSLYINVWSQNYCTQKQLIIPKIRSKEQAQNFGMWTALRKSLTLIIERNSHVFSLQKSCNNLSKRTQYH